MGVLADHQIVDLAERGMITPFEKESVRLIRDNLGNKHKSISFGPSSYGYDARLAPEFKIFHPYPGAIIDPKAPDERCFIDFFDEIVTLPAHSYCLSRTIETFIIPDDIFVLCIGKSTYARSGILLNVTPLEPGWRGQVTLEIANLTSVPARLYANEGIVQLVFLRGESACRNTYATKNNGLASKFQDQVGITLGRV